MGDVNLEQCVVKIGIDVQWRDMDALGHVNNAEYIRWFESARIEALMRVRLTENSGTLSNAKRLGPILASISCNYYVPVVFPDRVEIGAYVTRIGTSSFNLAYVAVRQSDNLVVARGDSVVVQFDYAAQKTAPLNAETRAAIEGLMVGGG